MNRARDRCTHDHYFADLKLVCVLPQTRTQFLGIEIK
jgi:hypothetical protein